MENIIFAYLLVAFVIGFLVGSKTTQGFISLVGGVQQNSGIKGAYVPPPRWIPQHSRNFTDDQALAIWNAYANKMTAQCVLNGGSMCV